MTKARCVHGAPWFRICPWCALEADEARHDAIEAEWRRVVGLHPDILDVLENFIYLRGFIPCQFDFWRNRCHDKESLS